MTIADTPQAELARLEREYQTNVSAAAQGDAEARALLPELRRHLEDARQRVVDDQAAAADVARVQQQAQAERTRLAEAERLRLAREAFQRVAEERDAIAVDALNAWLTDGIDIFKQAIEIGARVDAAASAAGWSRTERIDTAAAMARFAHDKLITELDRLLPGLGMLFGAPGLYGQSVVPLSRPPQPAEAKPLPPDRWQGREFAVEGPHVMTLDSESSIPGRVVRISND